MLHVFHYHGYHNYYSIADMISIHIFLLKSSSPVTELKGFFPTFPSINTQCSKLVSYLNVEQFYCNLSGIWLSAKG